jgi:diguanylate cyclase (GGDEF)-like protein/PAS domain S-box-containing protein
VKERLHILLVDDDEDEYVLLKQLISEASQDLGQTDFKLDWVETYAEAIEAYEKSEYDAYLVDYHLGDSNGLDLTAEAVRRGVKAPIILLTGQGSYNIDIAAMEAGAADYLIKSELNLPLLERSIRYAIEQKLVQERLEEMVQDRTRALRETNLELQTEIARRRRVEDGLRRAKEELEQRVEERTQALSQANTRLENAAADALRTAEEIHAVFNGMVEAVTVIDAEGFLLTANQVALQGFDIDPQGVRLEDLIEVVSLTTPDGSPFEDGQDPISRALRGETLPITRVLLNFANQRVHATVTASPLFDRDQITGAVAVWQDVSEREQLLDQLEAERARLRTIIEAAPAAILLTDPSARILLANPAAIQMMGKPLGGKAEMDSPGQMQVCYPDGSPYSPDEHILTRASLRGETYHDIEMLVRTSNGERKVMLGSAIPVLNRRGKVSGAVGLFQDITRRKQAEEETQKRARELDALHQAASALMGTLELDALLSQILEVIHNAIPSAEKGLLHLVLPASGELHLSAISGFEDESSPEFSGLPSAQMLTEARDPYSYYGNNSTAHSGEQRTPLDPPYQNRDRVRSRSRRSHPGYPGKIVREKRPLLINGLGLEGAKETHDDLLQGRFPHSLNGVQSLVAVPLLHREDCFGSLALASSALGAFNQGDLKLLESFAATASAAIENARLYAQVQRLSMTDTLTELYNRRGLRVVGQREIERARRFGRHIAAVMIDIDHFKAINDTYGHPVGDEVLRSLALSLRSMVRRVDVLARYGGEEFAAILPENSLSSAVEMAERVRNYFADHPVITSAGPISITISAGVAEVDDCVLGLDSLIDCADRALYKAKSGGRNRIATL